MQKEPNRLGATVGAAKAAEKSGDNAKALEYYKKVVAIAGDADKSRTEVSEARAFLERVAAAGGPVSAIHYIDVRQSMQNGGGPACLRLRVALTAGLRRP